MHKHLVIVSDIFGRCAGLNRLAQDLAATSAVQIQLIDPYQGAVQHFADEQQAYAAYSTQCGHDIYTGQVMQALQTAPQPFALAIGFSAGASALWRALADTTVTRVKQAVLFYPGQIHQQLALAPEIPLDIIFGQHEPHFAVADICAQLQQKPGVSAVTTPYAHGFINPASKAFSEAGYQQYLAVLTRLLGGRAELTT
ncbi:dienelactone hydrolase family protein [Rheinheimera sp.]|uniref:dienelactone hydrolase family protein n=1 Tax=Rheinheimera sp. TaxID=1869214 RepID=UPI002736ACF7|nr:dienelactone hydrolase family protein [Rheinheimera sp.]MDP2715209.1 dienelactone hydrolase family protein [Rheinheimera sp.]